jgi:hypothetical protein
MWWSSGDDGRFLAVLAGAAGCGPVGVSSGREKRGGNAAQLAAGEKRGVRRRNVEAQKYFAPPPRPAARGPAIPAARPSPADTAGPQKLAKSFGEFSRELLRRSPHGPLSFVSAPNRRAVNPQPLGIWTCRSDLCPSPFIIGLDRRFVAARRLSHPRGAPDETLPIWKGLFCLADVAR